ncbi:FAD binding domain-containing protein [Kamptonema formosum]|uniref:FAD binding domain-containing protein n=1 Tax=Kamptonema formosum TaxID=331992 RepID=UPI00034763A8|nr:xanthine dehydrogenase family protein subunit M [Oscillatoria sp. PCC 10802]
MRPFSYIRAHIKEAAIATVTGNPAASFIAGGTDLLGLMKNGVRTPSELVDINPLPLAQIEVAAGGARIGALARLSEIAGNAAIRAQYPVLSQALLESASPQLRNMATAGGNLMQRVRCPYFRDPAFPCNRRDPGTGCSAISGYSRSHAIFGTSEHCIAAHPSDLAVALAALDATLCTSGISGDLRIPIGDFYLLPGETPARETALEPGELIVAIEVPASPLTARSHYLKVRDRASFEFALVSAAVALEVTDGTVQSARVAFGGVAPKPWRSQAAEDALVGQPASLAAFAAAAEAAVLGAKPQQHNGFKIELVKRVLVRALSTVAGIS